MKEIVNKEEFEKFVIKINTSKDFSTQSVYITMRDAWLAAEEAVLQKEKDKKCSECKNYRAETKFINGLCVGLGNEYEDYIIVDEDFYCKNFKNKEK